MELNILDFSFLKDLIKTEGYFGVVNDEHPDTDFEIAGGVLNLPHAESDYFDKKITYQQTEVSPVSCTVHGSIGAVSDLTGYTFTLDERKKLWASALAQGADPKVGWSISKAVDLVRKYWLTQHPDQELMTFRILMASDDFFMALDKGYSLVCGFNGNAAYNTDRNDGILDNVNFGHASYGHCLRITKDAAEQVYTMVVDNYPQYTNPNTYKISKDHLVKLWQNSVFMQGAYVYVSKKTFDAMNDTPAIPLWAQGAVDRAKKAGVITEQTNLNQQIGTKDLEDIFFSAKIFTAKEGSVSLIRLLVAMDRLGAFSVK